MDYSHRLLDGIGPHVLAAATPVLGGGSISTLTLSNAKQGTAMDWGENKEWAWGGREGLGMGGGTRSNDWRLQEHERIGVGRAI